MTFAENFELVLAALNANSVNYMLVGGFAVNFYGYNRSTSDLDIWVKPFKWHSHYAIKTASIFANKVLYF